MRLDKLFLGCLVYSMVLAFTNNCVWAQDLISAKILSVEGRVEIRRQPDRQAAITKINFRVNDQLRAGDTIITHRGARLVLGLADGSQAVIGEKTNVELLDLSHSPRSILRVLRGRTRVSIERVGGRPNPYRVNTPTAVIAVRGTVFDLLVNEDQTRIFVHEGLVAVSNLYAPDHEILLSAGQRTRVIRGKSPENPRTFRPGRNDEMFIPSKRRVEPAFPGAADRVLGGDGFPVGSGNIPVGGSSNRPVNIPSRPPAAGRRP